MAAVTIIGGGSTSLSTRVHCSDGDHSVDGGGSGYTLKKMTITINGCP